MVRKRTKKVDRAKEPKQLVDNYAKILQIVAIIFLFAIIVVDALLLPKSEVQVWIYGGILGVAIGLSPEQMIEIIKAFIGARKK